jgi:hypothetical protein
MTVWEIILIVLALAILVYAWLYDWIRIPPRRSSDLRLYLGAMWVAVPTAVVVWVLARHYAHKLPSWAHGDRGWAYNGAIRSGLVFAIALAIGSGLWLLLTSKSRKF